MKGWFAACGLTERYIRRPLRADHLFSRIPPTLSPENRRICQFLFFGVVRYWRWIDAVLSKKIHRKPRPLVRAILAVALFEMRESAEDDGRRARIIDRAVGETRRRCSAQESGLVNAVLRGIHREWSLWMKMPEDPAGAAMFYSHPQWLAQRWLKRWGKDNLLALLKWNQQAPLIYVCCPYAESVRVVSELENQLEPTHWRGVYRWVGTQWGELEKGIEAGLLWVQDPSTHHPVRLLEPRSDELILDLCAAPGGKTRLLAATSGLESPGLLVSVDLPGRRFSSLLESIARAKERDQIRLLAADVREVELALKKCSLPQAYDAVLIDVPCSNTGVIRRRPEVKDRLQAEDIGQLASLQAKLLRSAARLVKPGGRLLYSTCSIEAEENEEQVEAFCSAHPQFTLRKQHLSLPWVDGHDGGGAFLLTRDRA